MRDYSRHDELPCELLLNGVRVQGVRIRQTKQSLGDFDIVVSDPVLGAFSLHSGFDINVHQPDSGWRKVSVDELRMILKDRNLLPAKDLPKVSEITECRLFARVDDIEIPHWQGGRLFGRGPEEACVRYVQRIFYRVGIPHLVAGTTFTVPSAPTAKIPLKRAGFRESPVSRSALVEPRTNVAIQVIQRSPLP